MKKTLFAIITAACATSAFAASDNTVRFRGEVANQTCSLDINGTEKSPIVLLPTVSLNDFKDGATITTGKTAGDTEFTINVSGCSPTKTGGTANNMESSLHIAFVGNAVTTANNLGNTGDAAGVSIQLTDNNVPFKFTSGDLVKSSQPVTIADDGSVAPITYVARYYAEDSAITAGTVMASAQYAITYK
ncbi:MAG: fimbrial protein [Morganella sp. (in: enterobacteria)]